MAKKVTPSGEMVTTDQALVGRLHAAAERWFSEHVHGSVRDTEAYNHLFRSMDALKALLVKAAKE